MIAITISGQAYAKIASTLPTGLTPEPEMVPDREYRVWVPREQVSRLRALRGPGESFSDIILRLASSGEPR